MRELNLDEGRTRVSHTQPWPRADSLEAIARTVAETEGMLATVHKLVATAVATVPCD